MLGLVANALQCNLRFMIRSHSTPLPSAPDGWFLYQYYLLSGGTLAVLWTDRDINTEWRAWRSRQRGAASVEKMPDFWNGGAQIVHITDSGVHDPITIPLLRFPLIDRFPDGHWLLASTRVQANENNAMILSTNGKVTRSFALGDGIEHLRCSQDGTIWVGYFDEGVFGGSVGSGGLVHFDGYGQPLWAYNNPQRDPSVYIDDCYALTQNGDEIWACFYSDFPILCLKSGKETVWTNNVSGAKALAIDGAFILLAGGYESDATRLSLLRLGDGAADLMGSWLCPELENYHLLFGDSSVLHIVNNNAWTRFHVSDVRSALA